MAVTAPTDGRHGLTPLRLTEVPLEVRRTVGQWLVREATLSADLGRSVALTRAIEEPTDTVYWLPTFAVEQTKRRLAKKWKP